MMNAYVKIAQLQLTLCLSNSTNSSNTDGQTDTVRQPMYATVYIKGQPGLFGLSWSGSKVQNRFPSCIKYTNKLQNLNKHYKAQLKFINSHVGLCNL